jgi:competence protein ComEA
MLLDGVGEARARGIVAYRDEHGPFRSIDDLEAVPRMPAGWVEKAREHLVVSVAPPASAEGAR